MNGAVLVDKPVGFTSNFVLQKTKKIFGAKKAGHAGTLDPLASGLLIVLFGEATKFAGPLLDEDKEYVATLKLGERRATGDAEGEVVERKDVPAGLEARLPAVLEEFRGEIEQVPPMYSALKRDGVPLYELARRGEAVEREPRRIVVREIEALRYDPPLLELRVRCSKGTYVRTLGEDIGRALGSAAHLTSLRRTHSGGLSVEQAASPGALEAMGADERSSRILPLERLLSSLPRNELDSLDETRFRHGQTLPCEGVQGLCGVFGANGAVIGLGRIESGRLHPVRLVASSAARAAASG